MERPSALPTERKTSQLLKEGNAQQESDLAVFLKQAKGMSEDELRHEILRDQTKRMELLKNQYEEQLTELFFLQNGGNMMDLLSWKRKPNRQRDEFMNQNPLVDEDDVSASHGPESRPEMHTSWNGHSVNGAAMTATTRTVEGAAAEVEGKRLAMSPPLGSFQNSSSAGAEDALRARQEAQVLTSIAHLSREGLWSSRRLPLVHEPPRKMAHWDYLLSEMEWMAVDFSGERRWKMAAAKKVC